MTKTKVVNTAQNLALSRLEKIFDKLHQKMEMVPDQRVKFKFLPTNTDRDILEPYDPEDETVFVGRNKEKFDRVYIGCSVTNLLTKGHYSYTTWTTI